MSTLTTAPRSNVDLFSEKVMAAPYEIYRELRDLGPAVYLERFDVFAVPRYEHARYVLGDWESFSSADIAFNQPFNDRLDGSILSADPPRHDILRGVLAARLALRAMRQLASDIQRRADKIIDGLVARGTFDAVGDLARRFPVDVVGDLIGLPRDGRDELLELIDANFNCFGPENNRTHTSRALQPKLVEYLTTRATREALSDGSMGQAVYDAVDAGQLPAESAPQLMTTYVTAGMDTTVHAVGHAVWLLAEHPDQWEALRSDPAREPQAFREVLRYESPVQIFGRGVRADWTVGDITVPAGARLAVLYGSANRDERKWSDPDRFDVTRANIGHIAFGYGLHGCAGQALAQLEGEAILRALVRRVSRLEAGEPVRHFNNVLRGLESLPVTVAAS
jgi:cytochrome P450